MLRHTFHVAVAVLACVVGASLVGFLNFVGQVLTPEPPAPAMSQISSPECNTSPLSAEQEAAKQEILEILRQYDIAQTNHDAAFFERVEAEGFTVTTPWGKTYSKAEAIATMMGWSKGTKYMSDDIWVQFYGEAAIVTGRMTATDDDSRHQRSWAWLHIFLRRGGHWQIVSTTQL